MEFVEGIEMGVGAYFNGDDFLARLPRLGAQAVLPRDLGELTGEMGTVVTYCGSERFFDLTLGRMAPLLKENGYCGYINLNTIVNERGFGRWNSPAASAIRATPSSIRCSETCWAELFRAMLDRRSTVSKSNLVFP